MSSVNLVPTKLRVALSSTVRLVFVNKTNFGGVPG
jgi:hypothetical protein